METGDYESALAEFDRAVQLEPDNARFYYERAVAHQAAGDDDRAIEDY